MRGRHWLEGRMRGQCLASDSTVSLTGRPRLLSSTMKAYVVQFWLLTQRQALWWEDLHMIDGKSAQGMMCRPPLPSQAEPGSVPATSSNLGLAWGPEHGLIHLHSNSESWHAGQTGWLLGLLIKVCASHSALRPHGLQPTSLLCPWDFPGKDTRMGCDFLLPSE